MYSMLVQLLGVDVKVDSNGFVSVKFNLDKWEEYIAGKFTGENAEKKGWLELAKEKPSDGAIMIQVNKYPKTAKAEYSADQIKQMIKVRVFLFSCFYSLLGSLQCFPLKKPFGTGVLKF